jgi:murein L,D-transpeptidase YcbB/YkuD
VLAFVAPTAVGARVGDLDGRDDALEVRGDPPDARLGAAEGAAASAASRAPADTLAETIRNRVEAAAGLPGRLVVGRRSVLTAPTLSDFYERRGYAPAWVTRRGLRTVGRALMTALDGARRDGLDPADYHLPVLRELAGRLGSGDREGPPDAGLLADLELLLTESFLLFGSHLLVGHLDPATLHPNWRAERRERDMVAVLERALESGDPAAALDGLRPSQPGYRRVADALEALRRLAGEGGWPSVPGGPKLSPGDSGERVEALRARLAASPFGSAAPGEPADPTVYDSTLAAAVRDFQGRHGLDPDAVVGPATLEALNVPAADRARQVAVNLERWRWLPEELGERHVLVNAADYRLEAVEGGETTLEMRAIVGRPYRQTPVFSDRISYMVFSPFWHVPHSLAVQDQLPLQRHDPGHLRRMGFRLFRGWGADAAEVDPDSVDWSRVTAKGFPYRLRQDPGPLNALGAVKFMFPNPYNVYLHDTPARELFQRQARSFSSGCIRVEKARELALWLLRGESAWTPERVDRAMAAGREETARPSRPVPVHLLYWTAWAEEDGTIQFRPDIYDRDAPVAKAMERTLPGPEPPEGPPFGEPREAP